MLSPEEAAAEAPTTARESTSKANLYPITFKPNVKINTQRKDQLIVSIIIIVIMHIVLKYDSVILVTNGTRRMGR